MTPAEQKLIDRLHAMNDDPDSGWSFRQRGRIVYLHWEEVIPTPDYARLPSSVPSGTVKAMWPEPTYERSVSVSGDRWVDVHRAPWVRSNFRRTTFKHIHEILDDPTSVFAQVTTY